MPWSGISWWAPHPTLEGTQLAIPFEQWDASMLRNSPPQGPFISKIAAHYPVDMNRMLIKAFAEHFKTAVDKTIITEHPTSSHVSKVEHDDAKRPMQFTARLRGNINKTPEDVKVGGMRRTARSMKRVPGHMIIGCQLSPLVEQAVTQWPGFRARLLDAITQKHYDKDLLNKDVHDLRIVLAKALGSKDVASDVDEVRGDVSTAIRAGLLQIWADAARDPARKIVRWLREGAPSVLTQTPA